MSKADETLLCRADIIECMQPYYKTYHDHDIITLMEKEKGLQSSLYISYPTFSEYESTSTLSLQLLSHPSLFLDHMNAALLVYQQQILYAFDEDAQSIDGLVLQTASHVRLLNLPLENHSITKATISAIRCNDVGQLLQINGTVIRSGAVRVLETSREYICNHVNCRHVFNIHSDLSQGHLLKIPKRCPSNTTNDICKSTSFEQNEDKTIFCDYQEIKIQESVQALTVGSIPRSIVVLLQYDLVDAVKPGEDVILVGVLFRRWKPTYTAIRCELESVFDANSVCVKKSKSSHDSVSANQEMKEYFTAFWKKYADQPLRARNHILSSICPQVYGMFTVKLSIALTLIGGSNYMDNRGMKVRGEPHMLLIGDPGTGKSQFLRFTASLAPRSVLTTGVGTTSAGLTCSAVKEGGEWMLEAGALVLADRGVCCIDEFGGIRKNDRSAIHEAMEQQTLSVAKAGLVCKLNTRTSVFAVTNPKGKYDMDEDVSVNTAIASPLLSRFDIILVLQDTANPEWDKTISNFVLRRATVFDKNTEQSQATEEHQEGTLPDELPWSLSRLQMYIAHVKTSVNPKLSPRSIQILQNYYKLQRSSDNRTAARTTIRLLESLTRLSQAHARLMMRSIVTVQDAVAAIAITEASLSTTSLLGYQSALHSYFPECPDEEYQHQEAAIITALGLCPEESVANDEPEVEVQGLPDEKDKSDEDILYDSEKENEIMSDENEKDNENDLIRSTPFIQDNTQMPNIDRNTWDVLAKTQDMTRNWSNAVQFQSQVLPLSKPTTDDNLFDF